MLLNDFFFAATKHICSNIIISTMPMTIILGWFNWMVLDTMSWQRKDIREQTRKPWRCPSLKLRLTQWSTQQIVEILLLVRLTKRSNGDNNSGGGWWWFWGRRCYYTTEEDDDVDDDVPDSMALASGQVSAVLSGKHGSASPVHSRLQHSSVNSSFQGVGIVSLMRRSMMMMVGLSWSWKTALRKEEP